MRSSRPATASFPPLAAAVPWLLAQAPPISPTLLYKAWHDVFGKDPDYPAQQIGDCVSFGHGHANDLLQCIEIALGEPADLRETDTEFIYATSRDVAGILRCQRRLVWRRRRQGYDDHRPGEPGNARRPGSIQR